MSPEALSVVALLAPAVFVGLCAALVPVGVISTLGAWRSWPGADRLRIAFPSALMAGMSVTVAVVGALRQDPTALCGVLAVCPV